MVKMSSLHCFLVSKEGVLFDGETNLISAPGLEGSFSILKDHVSFVSLLKKGKIILRSEGNEKEFLISSGILEVYQNQVSILVKL